MKAFVFNALKGLIVLVFFFGPLVCGYRKTDKIRDTYQASTKSSLQVSPAAETPSPPQSATQAPAAPAPSPSQGPAPAPAAPVSIPDPLTQQNKQMVDWGVLLLGGCVALCVSGKVHRLLPDWLYKGLYIALITPAAGCLLSSLWTGVVFQRRVAYLLIQQRPVADPLDALISFSRVQADLLGYAVLLLAVFALTFLLGIAVGKVDSREKP
jgi:hypothetical protein